MVLSLLGRTLAVLSCPPQCHCAFDSLNVAVDCSGLELTELPEFDDFMVSEIRKKGTKLKF